MSETLNPSVIDYSEDKTLTAACKRLLQQQSFTTQNELREALVNIGFQGISQSTVSRLLSQLGVVYFQQLQRNVEISFTALIDLIHQNKAPQLPTRYNMIMA